MIKRLLRMIWLLKHRDEFEAYWWFRSHRCSLNLSPTARPLAYLHPPGGGVLMFQAGTLAELRAKCEAMWNFEVK